MEVANHSGCLAPGSRRLQICPAALAFGNELFHGPSFGGDVTFQNQKLTRLRNQNTSKESCPCVIGQGTWKQRVPGKLKDQRVLWRAGPPDDWSVSLPADCLLCSMVLRRRRLRRRYNRLCRTEEGDFGLIDLLMSEDCISSSKTSGSTATFASA